MHFGDTLVASRLLVILIIIPDFDQNQKPQRNVIEKALAVICPQLKEWAYYISDVRSEGAILGLYCYLDSESVAECRLMDLKDSLESILGYTAQCRLYLPLDNFGQTINTPASPIQNTFPLPVLVLNAMTPTPDSEKSFNYWYGAEHIPMLQRVPFWHSSSRYILTESTMGGVPRYLALHEWDSLAGFSSTEYHAATNTAWRDQIIQQVVERERFQFTRISEEPD